MERNRAKLPFESMTDVQFLNELLPIVEHALFVDRERLLALLATDADPDTLAEVFRRCFEGYYYDVAFALDSYETRLLSILDSSDTYAALKHRVAIVQRKRRASPTGREVRRMGAFLPTDSVPEIKVSALSNHAFREFLHTLVKSEFFAAQARVVKLLNQREADAGKTALYEATAAEGDRLREAIYEFFVCHLEFEQFLEDYEYDPDEGLEIQPEVAEELEQSITDHKSGRVKGTPLQEVAKRFGVNLKCTH
ncbi:hypothetical protein F4054_17780 [Candidatus Poribacteria bacterium]|nr:hypothetical protein [Candidatus Poribacteria bacterium]MYK24096.1 hypothetical protein [Candidatus Poribacteria bacterium]